MRLTIIAGLVMGLALGIHSVLGSRAPTNIAHAAAVQSPHVRRAHVHRDPIVLRSTAAELADFAARGTLHGAPSLPNQMPIMVQVSRVDPLRGWLAFDFVRPADDDTATLRGAATPSRE